MRCLSTSLIALLAAAPALADDVFTQASIAAATVYPAGAELVHRATVDLPAGEHRVFLPYAGLDSLSSLPRIRTSPGVTIGALGFQRDMPLDREAMFTEAQAAAWARLEAADADLAGHRDQIASARAKVVALQARLDFLAAMKPGKETTTEDLIALANTIETETASAQAGLVAARAALRPMAEQTEDLERALAKAETAFERLSPPGDTSDLLSVAVNVAEAGPVTLELTEITPDAWWEMDYDLNLDRDSGTLDLARKLIVVQETGQSWTEAALTLSTARPGEETSPSDVHPDQARIHEPMEFSRTAAGAPPPMAEAMEMAPEPIIIEADIATAAVEIDGLAITYAYPDPVSIVSGEAAELALDALSLEAEHMIHAAPRHDETAFTVARFTNSTPEPILPGWANIMRDGHLVGREMLDMIPAGAETELGFGPMESIRLETIFARNEEGDTGIIARSDTREQLISFTVENLSGEAQAVRAFFPLTYSEQEDLRVRVSATPPPDETDIDRKRGVSAWDLEIDPGETAEVEISVRLDWPEGQNLVWYP